MVRIVMSRDGFVVVGHAEFAESGQDIVCSAVSALTQTAILGLSHFCEAKYIVKDGYINVAIPEQCQDSDSWAILKTTWLGLKEIEKDYPNHVAVWEEF